MSEDLPNPGNPKKDIICQNPQKLPSLAGSLLLDWPCDPRPPPTNLTTSSTFSSPPNLSPSHLFSRNSSLLRPRSHEDRHLLRCCWACCRRRNSPGHPNPHRTGTHVSYMQKYRGGGLLNPLPSGFVVTLDKSTCVL